MFRPACCLGPILILAAALGPSLGREPEGKTPTPIAASKGKVVLTEKRSGSTVRLAPGTPLTVQLSSNPTTGFRWQIVRVDPEVLALQGRSTYAPARPGLIGGGGLQTFHFRAVEKGTADLEIIYHRTFEKGKKPAKSFRVLVEVD